MQHDNYRPASYHVLRGGLDAAGQARGVDPPGRRAIDHRVARARRAPAGSAAAAGEALDGAADLAVRHPNLRVDYCPVQTPVPVGWWRSVYASQTCFANETFLDEIARRPAATAGAPARAAGRFAAALAVLNRAAEQAGWGTPLPAGRGRGIAIHKFFSDAIVAEVAEVTVDGKRAPGATGWSAPSTAAWRSIPTSSPRRWRAASSTA